MKQRWWAVPLLMLISAWPYTAIRELLFHNQIPNILPDVLLSIVCIVAVGFILRALCTKQAIRTGAIAVLGFSLIHLALAFVAPDSSLAWPSFFWGIFILPILTPSCESGDPYAASERVDKHPALYADRIVSSPVVDPLWTEQGLILVTQ